MHGSALQSKTRKGSLFTCQIASLSIARDTDMRVQKSGPWQPTLAAAAALTSPPVLPGCCSAPPPPHVQTQPSLGPPAHRGAGSVKCLFSDALTVPAKGVSLPCWLKFEGFPKHETVIQLYPQLNAGCNWPHCLPESGLQHHDPRQGHQNVLSLWRANAVLLVLLMAL